MPEDVNQDIYIPTHNPQEDFADFIYREGNRRIFFSAPYGTGKTYFLKEFFNQREEEFEVFHLSPVNYQIASTERIFEFLKYDLLVELQKKADSRGISLYDDDIGSVVASLFQNGLKKRTTNHLSVGVSAIATMAPTSVSTILLLGKSLSATTNFITKISKQHTKKGEVNEFIQSMKNKPSLGTEEDFLSVFIKEKVGQLKNGQKKLDEQNKQNVLSRFTQFFKRVNQNELKNQNQVDNENPKRSVLVLDDLDRLDPEHIFRLLNAFSAHTMAGEDEVKFGFDRIIIVGDRDNIKAIFQHKYGKDADFDGYFDKFSSISPYFLSLKDKFGIKDMIDKQFTGFTGKETDWVDVHENTVQNFLTEVVERMQEFNTSMNLRKLLKPLRHDLEELNSEKYFNHNSLPKTMKASLNVIKEIYEGDRENLTKDLEKVRKNLYQSKKSTEEVCNFMDESWIRGILEMFTDFQEFENTPDERHTKFIATLNGERYHFFFNGSRTVIVDLRLEGEDAQKNPTTPTRGVKLRLFYDFLIEYFEQALPRDQRYE